MRKLNQNKNPLDCGQQAGEEIFNFLTKNYKYKNLQTEREKRIFEAGFRHGIDFYHQKYIEESELISS